MSNVHGIDADGVVAQSLLLKLENDGLRAQLTDANDRAAELANEVMRGRETIAELREQLAMAVTKIPAWGDGYVVCSASACPNWLVPDGWPSPKE